VPGSDDGGDYSTFGELEAVLTQLERPGEGRAELAGDNERVAADCASLRADMRLRFCSAAGPDDTTDCSEPSPGSAPFYFTGGAPGSTKVGEQAAAATTAFPVSAPVVGYMGLTAGDVQRSESAL
jgi:hypothetical protein